MSASIFRRRDHRLFQIVVLDMGITDDLDTMPPNNGQKGEFVMKRKQASSTFSSSGSYPASFLKKPEPHHNQKKPTAPPQKRAGPAIHIVIGLSSSFSRVSGS